jgi:hypothetical protein
LLRKNHHQDPEPADAPLWLMILSSGCTLVAFGLYVALFYFLSDYQHRYADAARELPVFTRVILNIYQSYLGVFVLISVALLVLLFIKSRRSTGNYYVVFMLIVFNCVFAAVLFAVSFVGLDV